MKELEFYPHEHSNTQVNSLYQSLKWREELSREYRVQMVVNQGKHFYIYEPTGLISGDVVIPLFFYKSRDQIFAKCVRPTYKQRNHPETSEPNGKYIIIPKNMKNFNSDLLTINVKNFDLICSEIKEEDGQSFLYLAHNEIFGKCSNSPHLLCTVMPTYFLV